MFKEYRGLRKEVYILLIGRIVTNMGAMIWPMLTLILNKKLGMSAGKIADYFLLFSVCSLPMSLLGGRLADRFSKKRIIIACDLVSITGYVTCSLIPLGLPTVWILFFSSLFQAIENPSYDALLADLTVSKDRSRAYSLSYLATNLGLMLAPTIGGLLFRDFLWLAFLISGLSIALSTVLIFFLVHDISRAKEPDARVGEYERDQEGRSALAILRSSSSLRLYLLASILCGIVYSQFNYLMPLDLAKAHGDQGSVFFGTMTSLNCLVVVAGTPLITKLTSRTADISKLIIGELLILTGFALFAWRLGDPLAYYPAVAIFTLGEIYCSIASHPFITRRIPASHRGRILSIIMVSGSLCGALGQKVVGLAYDAQGSKAAWALILVIGAVAVLTEQLMRKPDRRDFPALYQK